MSWHDRDFFDPQYFSDISRALTERRFVEPQSDIPTTAQIGLWVVERVDQVLAAYTHLEQLPDVAQAAMTTFERAVEHFPDEITNHLRDNAGIKAFKGLFSTRNLDVYSMWARIAQRTHSTWHADVSWLHKLACALLRDSDFALKLDEAAECCRQGLDRRDTLARIEHHHQAMDSANTSAKSLLMLDLL